MGLRTRLKNRVRRILSRTEASPPSVAPHAAAAAPPASSGPVPPATPVAPPVEPARPVPPPMEAPPPKAPEPSTDSEAEAKAARHFERTRRAVLRFIDEQGGVSSLAEMHDYSERCLLYTSPSPRDRTRSRMPSSA